MSRSTESPTRSSPRVLSFSDVVFAVFVASTLAVSVLLAF
jgi:hypothetical protein